MIVSGNECDTNVDNQFHQVIDAFLKLRCHFLESDVVHRVLSLYPFERTQLQNFCSQFFECPPEKTAVAGSAPPVRDKKSVFKGRGLRRLKPLSESGVSGEVCHLVLPLCYLLVILIRTACVRVFEFHVEHLKQPVSHIKRGVPDEDDEDILEEYNDVIHLLVQKSS